MTDFIYDTECYPNIWSIGLKSQDSYNVFEISWRVNQLKELIQFLAEMRLSGNRMVGFNNIGYDYTVLHFIIENQYSLTVQDIYNKSNAIISTPWDKRFSNIVWDHDRHIEQIDLYKIHHFDNVAKATSLKIIEFNMRMESIQDLPFRPGTCLTWPECDQLIEYMGHDIKATEDFYHETASQIAFREELTKKYDRDFMNHNDTKVGKDYFIMELEKSSPYFDKRRQTPRESIKVSDIIFPYVSFQRPEFQRILGWFKTQTITDTKGAFTDINCAVDGFQFDFGTGGIHGSVESQTVTSDEDYVILDVDVASYYPNLAISNGLYPEHLGHQFCIIYKDMYDQRKTFKKGTTENAMLKLALNGSFGDTNNKYSPFYDPQYTMAITINGQLLLCMLAEAMLQNPTVQMIQANTDGISIKCPRSLQPWIADVCKWWEDLTKLELETVEYSRMFIRDVNNYIGEYVGGKMKRKGCYEHKLQWHQNHSALIVPKAAEAALVHGTDIKQFIESHTDIYDFMLRTKVPRNSRLVLTDYHGIDHQIQNVSRYYVSVMGGDLVKIMPPTSAQVKKGKTDERRFSINKGWKVTECNDIDHCNPDDIEYDWYIKEAEKLVNPLR